MCSAGKPSALLVSVLLVAAPAAAQEAHVVDPAVIADRLAYRVGEDDARREAVLRLLQRPEVRELAAKVQLDLKHAGAAVQTLEGEELVELASMAGEAEAGLSGGNTITLSTTTIIIGLLILILIIVAV